MKPIKGMFRYVAKHPLLWAVGLIAPSFAALAGNLAFAYGMQRYTAELTGPGAAFGRVVGIMLTTVTALLLTTLIEDAARYLFAVFIVRAENDVRQHLFSHLVRAKYRELGTLDRGELLTRYNADTGTAVNLITWDIFAVLWPLVLGGGYLITILLTNSALALLLFAAIVGVILLNTFFVKRFAVLEKAALHCREGFTQEAEGAIRGKMSIRLLSAGDAIGERMNREAQRLYENENAKVRLTAARAMSLEFLSTICGSLAAPLACVFAAQGLMTVAAVVLIAQLSRYLIPFTNSFGVALTSFGVHAVSYGRLRTVFDMQGEDAVPDGQAAPQWDATDTVLRCTDVGIAYEGKTVLRDVSFTLKRGEIVAVLGSSGSGKSSIVKALLGLVEHTGQIVLFGSDIEALPLGALRTGIAYVPEHSEVFDATVEENLRYAAPDRTCAQVRSALQDAALTDEDLYGAQAGEGGGKLSGGQRQRVAIARALLKDAPLYLLDEPTAALDAESESRVLQTLQGLKRQGKSLLIITHRESTASIADRVLRVRNGTLSADTVYDDEGLYRERGAVGS